MTATKAWLQCSLTTYVWMRWNICGQHWRHSEVGTARGRVRVRVIGRWVGRETSAQQHTPLPGLTLLSSYFTSIHPPYSLDWLQIHLTYVYIHSIHHVRSSSKGGHHYVAACSCHSLTDVLHIALADRQRGQYWASLWVYATINGCQSSV